MVGEFLVLDQVKGLFDDLGSIRFALSINALNFLMFSLDGLHDVVLLIHL